MAGSIGLLMLQAFKARPQAVEQIAEDAAILRGLSLHSEKTGLSLKPAMGLAHFS